MSATKSSRKHPITPAPCVQCGKLKPIHKSDWPAKYARRKYCSLKCSRASQDANPHTLKQPIVRTPCAHCGELKPVRDNDRPSSYARRQYCDAKCAGAARRSPETEAERNARRGAADRVRKKRKRDEKRRETIKALVATDMSKKVAFRVKPEAGAYRMNTLGTPCEKHPTERVGLYGCPACKTEERWREMNAAGYVPFASF